MDSNEHGQKYTGVIRKRYPGLTLTEVMIVCAVVTLLAGLVGSLAPKAVRAAKDSVCVSHLKQIDHAWSVYEGDHDGWSPPLPDSNIVEPKVQRGDEAFARALSSYLGSDGPLFCPLDSHARSKYQGEGAFHNHEFLSYTAFSVHAFYGAGGPKRSFRYVVRSALEHPATTILLFDTQGLVRNEEGTLLWRSGHGAAYSNALFGDGHVKRFQHVNP